MTDPATGPKRRSRGSPSGGGHAATTGERTKQRLMAAAEEVFARDGVQAGSIAAILRAAGQRNEAAISYHFGSREGLAVAIVESRRIKTAEVRTRMLADAAASGEIPTLRQALDILVRPVLPLLDSHSGRNYCRIVAEIIRGLYRGDRLRPRPADMRQTIRLLEACLVHQPEEIAEERLLIAFQLFVEAFANRAAELEIGPDQQLDGETWAENLLLVLEAILAAPVPHGPSGVGETRGSSAGEWPAESVKPGPGSGSDPD